MKLASVTTSVYLMNDKSSVYWLQAWFQHKKFTSTEFSFKGNLDEK
jgi:hypothetical protein